MAAPINDFKAFATSAGANVESQVAYELDPALSVGFATGVANSSRLNKVWRQSSFIAAAIAQFVANASVGNVLDNGDINTFLDLFLSAKNGFYTKNIAGSANVTLDPFNEANNLTIMLTGAITANIIVFMPLNRDGAWNIINATTGAFTVEIRTTGAAGVIIPSASSLVVVSDGVTCRSIGTSASGDYKDSVRFTTTANIALTGLVTQAGGDWPAVLTAGDRLLIKNQTAGAENGIWIAAAGAWARATDADTGAELNSGAIIPVESGTVNADTNWQLTTDGTIIIGATALTFTQIPSQFATNAEISTGAIANKSVSPLGLLQSLLGLGGGSENDYITIPYRDKTDGSRKNLIVQWGTAITAAAGNTIVLPIAFPNNFLKAYAVHNTPLGSPVYAMGANPSGLSAIVITSSSTVLGQTSYIAIGK